MCMYDEAMMHVRSMVSLIWTSWSSSGLCINDCWTHSHRFLRTCLRGADRPPITSDQYIYLAVRTLAPELKARELAFDTREKKLAVQQSVSEPVNATPSPEKANWTKQRSALPAIG